MPGMQQTLQCAEEGGMWNKHGIPLPLLLWEQVPLAFPALFLQAASWEPGPGSSCLFFYSLLNVK